jgi:hypothetical protein
MAITSKEKEVFQFICDMLMHNESCTTDDLEDVFGKRHGDNDTPLRIHRLRDLGFIDLHYLETTIGHSRYRKVNVVIRDPVALVKARNKND